MFRPTNDKTKNQPSNLIECASEYSDGEYIAGKNVLE